MILRGRPFPLVIAAPSGAGKTTLARALVERNEDCVFSISATTRKRREHERDGRDYYFVDDAGFDALIANRELVEWAVVHGHRYGTLRREIAAGLERGHNVVLDIDVQGARQIRAAFPEAVLVFILPPSAEELNRRLTGRGSEQSQDRHRRLTNARGELAAVQEFDYVIVNDVLEDALASLEAIVRAEARRVSRTPSVADCIQHLDRELGAILERSS